VWNKISSQKNWVLYSILERPSLKTDKNFILESKHFGAKVTHKNRNELLYPDLYH